MLVRIYIISFATHPQNRKDASNGEQTPFQVPRLTCQLAPWKSESNLPVLTHCREGAEILVRHLQESHGVISKGHFHLHISKSFNLEGLLDLFSFLRREKKKIQDLKRNSKITCGLPSLFLYLKNNEKWSPREGHQPTPGRRSSL